MDRLPNREERKFKEPITLFVLETIWCLWLPNPCNQPDIDQRISVCILKNGVFSTVSEILKVNHTFTIYYIESLCRKTCVCASDQTLCKSGASPVLSIQFLWVSCSQRPYAGLQGHDPFCPQSLDCQREGMCAD